MTRGQAIIFVILRRFLEQEFDDVGIASRDGHMHATCVFRIFLVLNASFLQHLDDVQVAVIDCVVQAVEALGVQFVDSLTHRRRQ